MKAKDFKEQLAINKGKYGDKSKEVLETLKNLGRVCSGKNRIKYLTEALPIQIKLKDEEETVSLKLDIAESWKKLGEIEKYINITKDIYNNTEWNGYSPIMEEILLAAETLSEYYIGNKKYSSAEKYLTFMLKYAAQKEADSDYDGKVKNSMEHHTWEGPLDCDPSDTLEKLKMCYIKSGKKESKADIVFDNIKRNAFSKNDYYF